MKTDLRKQHFGTLVVRHYAGSRGGKSYWCCACTCLPTCHDCHGRGCTIRVRSQQLLCGRAVSCGCSRTDSDTRRKAALKIPAEIRQSRAVAGGKCRKHKHPANFRLSLSRAADLIGCSPDRVLDLSRSGVIRTVYRKSGRLAVSANDVAAYIDSQSREPKKCQMVKTA